MAQTGCLILGDNEKEFGAEDFKNLGVKSPVYDSKGWNKYFEKTHEPASFPRIVNENPFIHAMTHDPVVRASIHNGLEWYKVKKEGLPEVTFKQADMLNSLDTNRQAKTMVYVMANSGSYVMGKNPYGFSNMMLDIKQKNQGKNVYVVFGYLEQSKLSDKSKLANFINCQMDKYGFREIPIAELVSLGVTRPQNVKGLIYRLER